jgi:hypothetical protein
VMQDELCTLGRADARQPHDLVAEVRVGVHAPSAWECTGMKYLGTAMNSNHLSAAEWRSGCI